MLRRFVGTNVIAATKIAKKHDKHLPVMGTDLSRPSDLSKRQVIGNMIRGSKAFAQLIAFSAEVDASIEAVKSPSTQHGYGSHAREQHAKVTLTPNFDPYPLPPTPLPLTPNP